MGSKYSRSGKFGKKLGELGGDDRAIDRGSTSTDDDRSSRIGNTIQFLISHGHRWKDIRHYTFGQLGVFFRETQTQHRQQLYLDFVLNGIANHPTKESDKIIRNMLEISDKDNKVKPVVEQSQSEIDDQWRKLASAMAKINRG